MATDVSTLPLAKAAFLASAGWFEDQSVALAKQHATAISALLLLLPNSALKGSNSVGYSKGELRQQVKDARRFVQNASSGGMFTRADFRNFRR